MTRNTPSSPVASASAKGRDLTESQVVVGRSFGLAGCLGFGSGGKEPWRAQGQVGEFESQIVAIGRLQNLWSGYRSYPFFTDL